MSSLSLQSRQPRRGQALLLAVLIMIFAALLSASFIAVVSVNLNQTARQTDKNRSVVAARAGLDYVKNRLAYSTDGDKWRSELENVPPAPGDADYAIYYTPLEIAQGWARAEPHPGDLNGNGQLYTGPGTADPEDERLALIKARATTGKLELVKSPDPRNIGAQLPDAPTFLSQVERIPNNSGTEQAGALKITVIGVSAEDPTAYTKSFAYFGGYKNSPVAQTMRTVSNWDFKQGRALVAQANPGIMGVGDGTGTAGDLNIKNATGNFNTLAVPFAITVSNPRTNTPARSAVVSAVTVNSATTAVFTLAVPFAATNPAVADDRIELAANLGAPIGIDYDNNPNTPAISLSSSPATAMRLSDGSSARTTNEVDGARVNAGLVWTGEILARKLRSRAFAFANGLAPGGVFSSGVMAFDGTPTIAYSKTDDLNPLGNLQPSNSAGIFNPATAADYSLVSDGWNGLSGKVNFDNTTRNIPDFQPPIIDEGPGVERYRDLTRFSKPNAAVVSPDPISARQSQDGYGLGIYIDNPQDKEKKTGTGAIPVELTQSEFVRLLMGSASGTPINYERNGAPITPATVPATAFANASLEEQHLRGWVGPDEFRARGAELILGNNAPATPQNPSGASITVIRDPRDDNKGGTANALGPVTEKAWKATLDGVPETGIYRKVLPYPANGMVFAEGNLRIRGTVLDPPSSLTVVSMNNLYIEDSLQFLPPAMPAPEYRAKKILLMARKNVVMNPTRVLGRPDAQTTIKNPATFVVTPAPIDVNVDVLDAPMFQVGDFVRTSTNASTRIVEGYVKSVVDSDTLEITPTSAGVVAAGEFLKTPNTAPQLPLPVTATTRPIAVSAVTEAADVMQRRVEVSPAIPQANLRLTLDHQGKRIDAFTASIKDTTPPKARPTDEIYFSNKGILLAGPPAMAPFLDNKDSLAATADKRIRGQFTDPLTTQKATDEFPTVAPASEADARLQTLSSLKNEMDAKIHDDPMNPGSVAWQYDTSFPNMAFSNLPFFYLAGVGNRYDFGGTPFEGRKNINIYQTPPGVAYIAPLSNTMSVFVNSVKNTLSNEAYNLSLTRYERSEQVGFSPNYFNNPNEEDVLTSDQGFYQNDAAKTTVDSRQLSTFAVGQPTTISMRQGDLPVALPLAADYPEYRVFGMKTENVALTSDPMTGVVTLTSINPSKNFVVNAFVYAQTGSWLVIPGARFNDRLKSAPDTTNPALTNTFLDINDNNTAEPGEYIIGAGGNGYPDLNRDGVIDDVEKYALERYSQYNYQINFTGAIAENQTALVNDAGTGPTAAKGAVADWMTKWATTVTVTPATTPPTIVKNRIQYIFDSTVVLNDFQRDFASTTGKDETDYGFRLPYAPELFNVS